MKNSLFFILSMLLVACDVNGPDAVGDRVNDVYVGLEALTEEDGATQVYAPSSEDFAVHNSIVVANDGSAVIGTFNDECFVHLQTTGAGWQDVARSCVVPMTGEVFVMRKAAILLYDTTYILVISGEYQNRDVFYTAVMGVEP